MTNKRSAHGASDDDDGKRLFLRPGPQVNAYLEQIVATGLHGSNPTEVAMSLLRQGIQDMVRAGVIEMRKK